MSTSVAMRTASSLVLVALAGCATRVVVTPDMGRVTDPACRIHAVVLYDANPDYLPQVIARETTAAEGAAVLRYRYVAEYGVHEIPAGVQFINPLMIVGFPTGNHDTVITATLDVVKGGTVLRSYAAASTLQRTGTIFSEGETFTEMRRRGLHAVRDNISIQMCRDERVLEPLLSGEPAQSNIQ